MASPRSAVRRAPSELLQARRGIWVCPVGPDRFELAALSLGAHDTRFPVLSAFICQLHGSFKCRLAAREASVQIRCCDGPGPFALPHHKLNERHGVMTSAGLGG